MTLTNRLLTLVLVAPGIVLVGFSLILLFAVRVWLIRQLDERAEATASVLIAAAEVEPEGIEWEPGQRRLNLSADVVWAVFADDGRKIDGSSDDRFDLVPRVPGRVRTAIGTDRWQGLCRTLDLPDPPSGVSPKHHASLSFVAVLPLSPIEATLQRLAATMLAVSIGIWAIVASAARSVCRRVLRPLRDIASRVRTTDADDLTRRLPVPDPEDELRELTLAYNGLLTRLHEAFARQSRFTSEASHQLRTPLTAMLGQVDVALRRDREPAEYRRVLALVSAQSSRLGSLIEMLLFLARADRASMRPHFRRLDLRSWLADWLAASRSDLPRFDDIRLVGSEGSPTVLANAELLGQAVGNIVENACHYSDPGSEVELSTGEESGWAILRISDRGWGIAPEELHEVCEPFRRGEEAKRRGASGMGLGLAISSRIVETFDGRIDIASEPGRGTRVEIRLPTDRG